MKNLFSLNEIYLWNFTVFGVFITDDSLKMIFG